MKTVQQYKICRRLGPGVFEKCQTPKFVMSEARHAKAKKGKRPKPMSAYGTQFIEKQKVVARSQKLKDEYDEPKFEDVDEWDYLIKEDKTGMLRSGTLAFLLEAYQNIERAFVSELPLELALIKIIGQNETK